MTERRDKQLQKAIEGLLEDRGASSADGCSALTNALLNAFVRLRQDAGLSGAVTMEMRRLATRITQLADAPVETVADMAVALSDRRILQ